MIAFPKSKAGTKPVTKTSAKATSKEAPSKTSKGGRPPLPPELRRSSRIAMRTYPEIAEKVARNGTEWMERLISRAKEIDHEPTKAKS